MIYVYLSIYLFSEEVLSLAEVSYIQKAGSTTPLISPTSGGKCNKSKYLNLDIFYISMGYQKYQNPKVPTKH